MKKADERQSAIQAIRDRYGMDVLDAKTGDLGDRLADATQKLMEMPAPDLDALRWKLDYLSDGGTAFASWDERYSQQTFADLARLMPTGH